MVATEMTGTMKYKATIERHEQQTMLVLNVDDKKFEILLTEDRPNEIKSVFNRLLQELKKGEIVFAFEDGIEDLYHHVAQEYIKQLNVELSSVFQELKDYDLLED
jgi:hypothetical protein